MLCYCRERPKAGVCKEKKLIQLTGLEVESANNMVQPLVRDPPAAPDECVRKEITAQAGGQGEQEEPVDL